MLKLLRRTNYEVFEKACKELGVEYTIPPLHAQKVHRRILAKKALCIRVRISTVGCLVGLPGPRCRVEGRSCLFLTMA